MSLETNREALRGLDALARQVLEQLRKKTEGARFLRSEERSAALQDQLRIARHHLQLALDAVENQPTLDQLATPTHDPRGATSWLRDRVSGLVGILSGRQQPPRMEGGTISNSEALEGHSAALSVPSLIGALHAEGKSGVLHVTHAAEVIQLHFQAGALVHAFSESSPQGLRLGAMLVSGNALTEESLGQALAEHEEASGPLGEHLIRGGWIDRASLEDALEEQIRALFERLWTQPDASYTFTPGLPKVRGERCDWNVTQLLLEGGPRQAG